MNQDIFNLVLTAASLFGGWWLKSTWETLKALQKTDTEMANKMNDIEVLMAGGYVNKDEFNRVVDRLFKKLDVIDDKINKVS